jgi:hypothetical protein
MHRIIDWFTAWIKAHNITAHTIGLAIVTAAFAYDSSPQLRDYIGTVFTGYPVVVTHIGELAANIVAGVTLWRNYSSPHSKAGAVAHSNAILDESDAPTAAEVDAATTKQ